MSPVPNLNIDDGLHGPFNGILTGLKQSTHNQDLAENPLHRLWRGNKEGTVTMAGVPKFENKYDEREWIKVTCFSRVL